MKILMAYPFSRRGGVETFIREITRFLERRNMEILFPRLPDLPLQEKRIFFWFKYRPREKVDIIHLHEFSFHCLTSRLPKVSTFHGSSWARFRLLRQKRALFPGLLEKLRYKFSNRSVAVSREIQRWYPHSLYIPNGVDTRKFNPNVKGLNIDTEKIKIIWVGRKEGLKGYKIIKNLRKDFFVIECTSVAYEEMPKYYNSADVFVLPSFYEGMPLTVLEAMACGLPVVAFRVGGLPDCVFDGVNGYLVEPGNVSELIEKIKLAYENRRKLGRKGRKLCELIFNWKNVAECYTKVYNEVLENG